MCIGEKGLAVTIFELKPLIMMIGFQKQAAWVFLLLGCHCCNLKAREALAAPIHTPIQAYTS